MHNRSRLSRRTFLKLGGGALLGLAFGRKLARADPIYFDPPPDFDPPPAPWGRIINWREPVRRAPTLTSEIVAWKDHDDIIPLKGTLLGEAPWPSNPVWYYTEAGFIHSAYVHPSHDEPQRDLLTRIPKPGLWAEVCVPLAKARWEPDGEHVYRKLYYETVYRIVDAVRGEGGRWWYQLQEGITWAPGPYAPATSLRPIPPEALTPISAGHPKKRLKINIGQQTLTCFEDQRPVFITRVASGLWDTATPIGEFRILYKRHAQRMVGDDYDLAGVAFPSYFTHSGVAIHGTYWHNDYGRRHSHGCLNVPSQAARWIFRWVDPPVPYERYTHRATTDQGTRVVVVL